MKTTLAVCIVCLAMASVSSAEVSDSSANGFTLKINTTIHAAPAEVYDKLVRNVGDWWLGEHTYSGDSHNLSIEERAGGCFCEKLPDGAVRHMVVVFFRTGKTLRLVGGLGPLQQTGASGALSFNITPEKDGSKLDVIYAVSGYLPQGMNTWAAPVDSVLSVQITRLKSFVETGSPDPVGSTKK